MTAVRDGSICWRVAVSIMARPSLLFASMLLGLWGALALPSCEAETDAHCVAEGADLSPEGIQKCLASLTDKSSDCTTYLALMEACAKDLSNGAVCGAAMADGEAMPCLLQRVKPSDLSSQCAAALPTTELKGLAKFWADGKRALNINEITDLSAEDKDVYDRWQKRKKGKKTDKDRERDYAVKQAKRERVESLIAQAVREANPASADAALEIARKESKKLLEYVRRRSNTRARAPAIRRTAVCERHTPRPSLTLSCVGLVHICQGGPDGHAQGLLCVGAGEDLEEGVQVTQGRAVSVRRRIPVSVRLSMASGVERGRTRLQLVWISPRVGERDGKKQEAAMLVYGACRVRFFAWAFGGWRRGLSGLALHWGASVLTQCRDRLQRLYRDRDRISFRRNGPSQVKQGRRHFSRSPSRHNARRARGPFIPTVVRLGRMRYSELLVVCVATLAASLQQHDDEQAPQPSSPDAPQPPLPPPRPPPPWKRALPWTGRPARRRPPSSPQPSRMVPHFGPFPITRLQRLTNAGNGFLLMLSAPITWKFAGGVSAAALRGLALSSWLSVCGILLLLRELSFPFMRRWLRRHVRFSTTRNGRSSIHLFAATLALSTGSTVGSVLGVVTLANFAFGRFVRSRMRAARAAQQQQEQPRTLPPMVSAPPPPVPVPPQPPVEAPLPTSAEGAPESSAGGAGTPASGPGVETSSAAADEVNAATVKARRAAAAQKASDRARAEEPRATRKAAAARVAAEKVAAERAAAEKAAEERAAAAAAKRMEEEKAASESAAAARREADERERIATAEWKAAVDRARAAEQAATDRPAEQAAADRPAEQA